MQAALKGHPEHPFEQPPGIVSIRIDPYTGTRTSAHDPVAFFEYFMTPYVPGEEEQTETNIQEEETPAPPIEGSGGVY